MKKEFIKELLKLNSSNAKEINKLMKDINLQLMNNEDDETFKFLSKAYDYEDFIKIISIFGIYLSAEFQSSELNELYKAAFELDEYICYADDITDIEEYINDFPMGRKIQKRTLIAKGILFANILIETYNL